MRFFFHTLISSLLLIMLLGSCALVQTNKTKSVKTDLTKSNSNKNNKVKKVDKQRNSINRDSAKNIQITTFDLQTTADNSNSKSNMTLKCQATGQCIKLIQHKIISEWKYRRSYPKYKTILVLELTKTGYINTIKLKRSSGLRAFDDSVINAVLKAEPFTEITYLPPLDLATFESIEMVFKR